MQVALMAGKPVLILEWDSLNESLDYFPKGHPQGPAKTHHLVLEGLFISLPPSLLIAGFWNLLLQASLNRSNIHSSENKIFRTKSNFKERYMPQGKEVIIQV